MDNLDVLNNPQEVGYFERVSIFKREFSLIFFLILFSIFLFIEIDVYLFKIEDRETIRHSIGYIMVFIPLLLLYFPERVTKFQIFILITLAIVIRIKLLFIEPLVSSDLQRNLIFGSLFQAGYNPYLWTIEQIPELIQNFGFVPKVDFATPWEDHSYDYPFLAITFFSIITALVPADGYSAFVLAKFILIVIDALNAYIIYKIIRVHFNNKELGKKIGLIYLLNPLSIFLVVVEGQFEPIPLFFILVSIFFLFHRQNEEFVFYGYKINHLIPYVVGFLMACGVLFKYFPIFYIPAILYYFGKKYMDSINFLISFFITSVLISLPGLLNSYYISNFVLFQLDRPNNWFNGVTYPFFGFEIPLLLIFMLMIFSSLIFFYIQKDKKSITLAIGTLSMYVFIYFNPSMFPWYILWFYGTLLFIGIKTKDSKPSLYDDMLPSLYWVMSLSVLVTLWNPELIPTLINTIIFAYIVTSSYLRMRFVKFLERFFDF